MDKMNYEYTFNGIHTIVNPAEIKYAYSQHRVCYLVMEDGEEHRFYKKLDELEKELEEISPEFVRTGKSFLVNRKQVRSYSHSQVMLKDGQTLPVGRAYYNQLIPKLQVWKVAIA